MANKNILVIGNGFDLYHGLKTSYVDFVRYLQELTKSSKGTKNRKLAINNCFVKCFDKVVSENQSWIDCEKEIEVIVSMILKILYDGNVFKLNSTFIERNRSSLYSYEFERLKLMNAFCKKADSHVIAFQEGYFKTYQGIDKNAVIERLRKDLNDLIRLFKNYLEENVINQPVVKLSEQIKNINTDYVINFNYTNTYEQYDINRNDVCYIHGSLQDNNLVLGIRDIDESDINSIHFKKYFQRIQKHTDVIQWNKFGIKSSLSSTERDAITYFFGHSLSNNDGDIIRSVFEHSEKIVVFYMQGNSNRDFEQKVINLIDSLGKETVINGMHSGKISFESIK